MASAVASAIVSAWGSSSTVEAGFVSTVQNFRLSFTKISRRKLSISCSSSSSSQDASEAGGSSKPRRRKKSTDSPGVNGASKRASAEPEDKKVTRAKRKELDEKKSKKTKKKTEASSLEDDAQSDLTGDETEVIVGTDTDSDADVEKKPAGKKVTRAKRKEAAEKKARKSTKKAEASSLEDDAQSEAGDETDMIEDTEEEEEASDAERLKKKTTKQSTRKKVTKAEKETSSEDVRKKPRKKKTAAEMKAEEQDDQKKQSKNIKKAGKKPPKTTAGASEASDEKKLPTVEPEIVEDEAEESPKRRKALKKPARKSTKETSSFKKPMTDEEADLLYEKEGRWQLMEEERRRLNQRYMEKLASSDEEEEEVYSEDDEDDEEAVDEEEKPSDHIIDMKFPEKDCYALVESYKPRKIGKDEKPPLKNEELWWNWRKPDFTKEHYWSEHQNRHGLPDITLAAMTALTGRIKLFGDTPSVTETHIYRARKEVFYEERLRAEEKRRKEIGPMAYYQEWVKAWDKDTSKEAVQKHYEETGEDVAMQLMNMIACQTKAEFNHMMGTDPRIRRDPLVMRATKEMKKSVFGGDPVYPTINYIKKPGAAVDFRGPNFHEPTPSIIERLKRCGIMKTREEHNKIMAAQVERMAKLAEEESDEESDEEMAGAIDIGEDDDEDVEEGGAGDDDLPFKEEDVSIVPTQDLLQIPEEDDDI